MREDVLHALAIGPSSSLEDRVIDITMTGRTSGNPRRMEIMFHRIDGSIYLSGTPGRRDWLANLAAEPRITFHLKHGVVADLPAVASVITDGAERRRLLAPVVDEFNQTVNEVNGLPPSVLDEWVEGSPLARIDFVEDD